MRRSGGLHPTTLRLMTATGLALLGALMATGCTASRPPEVMESPTYSYIRQGVPMPDEPSSLVMRKTPASPDAPNGRLAPARSAVVEPES